MARYIDANELQKKLTQIADEPDYLHEGESWDIGVCLAGTQVDLMPTADVVEVPCRCGECKHCHYGICDHYIMAHENADADDFCSYGERK